MTIRQKLEGLDDDELQRCLHSFGRDKVVSSIFRALHDQVKGGNMEDTDSMQQILLEIEQSREDEESDEQMKGHGRFANIGGWPCQHRLVGTTWSVKIWGCGRGL